MNVAVTARAAGRMCPTDYNYSPTVFNRAPEFETRTLYVVGGLYGNPAAFDEVERLANSECATVVFNGDFHWFDAESDWFAAIEVGVGRHHALRGNVETEIARRQDIGAGCGCAYPSSVGEDVVRRSNQILRELRAVVPNSTRQSLSRLPMLLVAQVGPLRIGVVHGDAASLAGWRFAHDAPDDPAWHRWLNEVRQASRIDVFASTHTCLAALRDFALAAGRLTVVNNGAAGMPNFSSSTFGLVTRISVQASPHPTLYSLVRDDVHIDAVPLYYDQRAFLERFLARWPAGSPAHASYFGRIVEGPAYAIASAAG